MSVEGKFRLDSKYIGFIFRPLLFLVKKSEKFKRKRKFVTASRVIKSFINHAFWTQNICFFSDDKKTIMWFSKKCSEATSLAITTIL